MYLRKLEIQHEFEPVSSEEGALQAPHTSSGFHPALAPLECYATASTGSCTNMEKDAK